MDRWTFFSAVALLEVISLCAYMFTLLFWFNGVHQVLRRRRLETFSQLQKRFMVHSKFVAILQLGITNVEGLGS